MLIRQKKFNNTYSLTHKSKFKKKYHNPFKRQPQKKKFNFSVKKLIFFSGALFIIIAVIWLAVYSPLFKIKEIILNGAGPINKNDLLDFAWSQAKSKGLVPHDNLLLFDKNKLISGLKTQYYLKNIAVDKKFFSTLEIKFERKDYAIIWLEDGKYFYVDIDGDIVTELDPATMKKGEFGVIENISSNKIINNKITLDPPNIDFAIKLYKELSDKKYSLSIAKLFIDNDVNVLKARIESGPEVYFNTKDNLNSQTNNLYEIRNVRMKDSFNKLKYIDLRNGDKIYFKN
jgi:cell division septal protein FtsQ